MKTIEGKSCIQTIKQKQILDGLIMEKLINIFSIDSKYCIIKKPLYSYLGSIFTVSQQSEHGEFKVVTLKHSIMHYCTYVIVFNVVLLSSDKFE